MTPKFIEIRDRGTFVPSIAFDLTRADHYLADRAGFGDQRCVVLLSLATYRAHYDPYDWGDRTYHVAHLWLAEHWDDVASGDVVDVQFILGETAAPKVSESVKIWRKEA